MFSKNYYGFNYSAGVSRKMKSILFRANLSSGFRPPHLSELLANGVHHATLRYEIGNQQLLNEQSVQIDLSAEKTSEHLGIIINPFFNRFTNYIYLNPDNSKIDNLPVYKYAQ